jgi:two-component system chemotaxis sensor kinase CheA
MDAQKEAYRVEAGELLGELETSLLELEQRADDMDLVDRVFRAMHTIKGSGAMFGFDAIAEFTHDVESVFDRVREGRLPVTTHLVNLALQARDHIKSLLDNTAEQDGLSLERGEKILAGFRAILAADGRQETPPAATAPETGLPEPEQPVACEKERTYRIRFSPHGDLFRNGTNPLPLLAELCALGTAQVMLQSDRLPDPEPFDPEACYLYWDIVLTTAQGEDAIKDVFIFVDDACDLSIKVIDEPFQPEQEPCPQRLGEILMERGDLTPAALNQALEGQKRLGQILVESRKVSPEKVHSALAEQERVQSARLQREKQTAGTSVRVAAEKLDSLVNLVGELVTVQARLSQKAAKERDPDLLSISEVVERLTAELRDNTLSIRMLPIEVTFSKLRRLVRDLSRDLGKNIQLQTEGGDTELDKTVIEQLNDPLLHILRNSIDHGIEPPAQRQAAGKTEQGVIHLKAEHSGASVLIHISDDGKGIETDKLRQKAIAKGLLAADAEKSDKELLQLIFQPGLSTAAAVTNVSGRGVGMDVVKRSIENLRGSIALNSQPGAGTTITLQLPLTLAIIDGLLVQIDSDKFVLPLSAIEECVELTRDDLAGTHGRNILNIRGQIVPFVPLRKRFAIDGEPPPVEQVVINAVDGQRVGIVVDRVIGEHQIVIKTMNALYKDVREVSGATILGDGSVALILDVQKLLCDLQATQMAA